MVATIAFFFHMVDVYLDNMHLSDRDKNLMHNYYIKRRDGTTAAERFFEAKPNDLFEFLLNNVDYPARPRNQMKL